MNKVKDWLKSTSYRDYALSVASADASFRKYYRLQKENKSFIVMDSSLELSSLEPFLDVTKRLFNASVNAPHIYEKELALGYLILEDFGDINLLDSLNEQNYQTLYMKAIDELITMQKANTQHLPLYNKTFLHLEMDLMKEWYLEKKLGITLDAEEKKILKETLETISTVVLSQPQNIFVHRDFHSRNIMLAKENKMGIIDYQDAMSGAITYDLVSLLKDCYIEFDREKTLQLVLEFKRKKNLEVDDAMFIKWFDFMGMQRHIKVLGIFSRLHLRDKKDGYLKDIPLTLKYTVEALSLYTQTKELAKILTKYTS